MASISTPAQNFANAPGVKTICQLVGLACLAGFAIDMLVILLPPQLGSAEWRLGFMQQLGDRGIIFLLGSALTIAGSLGSRRRLRQFSSFCLLAGVVIVLSSFLVIMDGLALQQRATTTIDTQASQLQNRLRDAQANPTSLGANVTLEDIKKTSQQLTGQAEALKKNAKTTVVKTGVASVGNLAVVGLGLLGIGRTGLLLSRK